MRLLVFAILLLLVGCTAYVPNGVYKMKGCPKTILLLKPGGNFQFILDYQNPYITKHDESEQYYFQTQGKWIVKGRNVILNSWRDSMLYSPYYVYAATDTISDSNHYEFSDVFDDLIPILSVKSSSGEMKDMNNAVEYYNSGHSRDTLQFYFFGYTPVTIINRGKTKDYRTRVLPQYRPDWIKNLKLRVKKYTRHGLKYTTLNWNYLRKKLNNETDKKYKGPPMY